MVTTIHDTVLKAGLKLGGPLAWKGNNRPGFTFFQGPGETALMKEGAPIVLGTRRRSRSVRKKSGVAPLEGTEK